MRAIPLKVKDQEEGKDEGIELKVSGKSKKGKKKNKKIIRKNI